MTLYCWFSSASSKAYLPHPERKLEVENANMRVMEAMETLQQKGNDLFLIVLM